MKIRIKIAFRLNQMNLNVRIVTRRTTQRSSMFVTFFCNPFYLESGHDVMQYFVRDLLMFVIEFRKTVREFL